MSKRLDEIARRKRSLIEQAARERGQFAAAYKNIRSPFDLTAALSSLGHSLKTHPLITAAVSSFMVSGYASKLLKPAGVLLRLWRLSPPIWAWGTMWYFARPLWSWWTKRRRAK